MRVSTHKMGSPKWADDVFNSKASRELRGPSRWTQNHHYKSEALGQYVDVQGRNEFCSALAVEYLINMGYIEKVKAQPFKTSIDEFGSEIYPDFLFQVPGNPVPQLYVLETKSHRFLSPAKQWEIAEYRAKFKELGMKYLLWTDVSPLSKPVRDHLMYMRMASSSGITDDEIVGLMNWVKAQGRNATLGEFSLNTDMDRDVLYAAAWKGHVFIPLTQPLSKETRISGIPQDDFISMFLGESEESDSWWKALADF
ncbi:hypothetical protein [Herbaspirillum sp. alder98]|uniref:hypothetical protein n=1 Tax=Herbaspirillum sp. alder98 TaxID=2913096 RepID=UPI001CD83AE7|nr:hypothetical protein [Herbaspirillum sp. alder98]MCA1325774.1 hypothetical protein [Herbaspirillum sp. alder98]